MNWRGNAYDLSPIAMCGGLAFIAVAIFGLWVDSNYMRLELENREVVAAWGQARVEQQRAAERAIDVQIRSACELELQRNLECNSGNMFSPLMPSRAHLEGLLRDLPGFQQRCGSVVSVPSEMDLYSFCGTSYAGGTNKREYGSGEDPGEYGRASIPLDDPPGLLPIDPWPIVSPRWARTPEAGRISRYFPDRAWDRGQSGRVVLACTAQASGELDCLVEEENPSGWGFGQAALRASRHFRLERFDQSGRPIAGGTLRLPIVFDAS